jgi:catalase
LVRKVMNDAQRNRLVSNVVGHIKNGVSEPVLGRTPQYWRNIDKEIRDRIAKGVKGSWSTRSPRWPAIQSAG